MIASGGVVAIAGEGRIHARESEVRLPLSEGAAYFAMRSGVPLSPVSDRGHELASVRWPGLEVPRSGRGFDPLERPTEPRRTDRCDGTAHGGS